MGAQGAGERVQLVLHGHGQSCSRAQLVTQPREGALSLRFKRPPQGWESGLLLSNVTFCGAAVAVRGTGRMFAAETNSGGVADAKTWESEGPGETGMG